MNYNGPQADTFKDPEVFREFQELSRQMAEIPRMPVIYREPTKPREGMYCICDGANWNPLGDGIKRPVWFDEVAGTWNPFNV